MNMATPEKKMSVEDAIELIYVHDCEEGRDVYNILHALTTGAIGGLGLIRWERATPLLTNTGKTALPQARALVDEAKANGYTDPLSAILGRMGEPSK
jgi:hypothetical protein